MNEEEREVVTAECGRRMVALLCGSLVLLGRELRRKKKKIGRGGCWHALEF